MNLFESLVKGMREQYDNLNPLFSREADEILIKHYEEVLKKYPIRMIQDYKGPSGDLP